MTTVAQLKEYGANTEEGLARCMGNEAFYLRLVGMVNKNDYLSGLEKAVAEGDLKAGFEAAHALKGVLANLALTPALTPVSELTELLRAGTQMDYTPLLTRVRDEMQRLLEIIG